VGPGCCVDIEEAKMSTRIKSNIGRCGWAAAALFAATLALPRLAAADLDGWEGDKLQADVPGDAVSHRRGWVVRGRPVAAVRRPGIAVRVGPVVVAPLWRPRVVVRAW
jgi:hypothetical protein